MTLMYYIACIISWLFHILILSFWHSKYWPDQLEFASSGPDTPLLNNRVCHMKGSQGVDLAMDSHKLTDNNIPCLTSVLV